MSWKKRKKWNCLIWLLWQPVNNAVLLLTACIRCWQTQQKHGVLKIRFAEPSSAYTLMPVNSDNNSSLKVMLFILDIFFLIFNKMQHATQILSSSIVKILEFQKYGTTVHTSLFTHFCWSHSQTGIKTINSTPPPPQKSNNQNTNVDFAVNT
jgi:hypothetical protein